MTNRTANKSLKDYDVFLIKLECLLEGLIITGGEINKSSGHVFKDVKEVVENTFGLDIRAVKL